VDRFVWQPGLGIDVAALTRLRSHFPCPVEPMGEAWFMGAERRMYHELQGDLAALPIQDIQNPLGEIASGTGSFGPMREWEDWYHYLLAEVLPRGNEHCVTSLIETLITGFFALHPNGISVAPYREFPDDALLTLGRCIMDEQCWNGTEVAIGNILHRSNHNPGHVWRWWDASGDFSASMFFSLKYLPEPLIREWMASVLAIRSPYWRAQLIVWLVGAHDLLAGRIGWPSQLPESAYPSVAWDWSHCIKPELSTGRARGPAVASWLSERARAQVLQIVHAHFDEDVYLEWLASISTVPAIESEIAEIPSTFEALYVRSH
jgi:hypothetical protein